MTTQWPIMRGASYAIVTSPHGCQNWQVEHWGLSATQQPAFGLPPFFEPPPPEPAPGFAPPFLSVAAGFVFIAIDPPGHEKTRKARLGGMWMQF